MPEEVQAEFPFAGCGARPHQNTQKVPASSSQMIFGKRPPEARGARNKILSAGGSNNNFYKSAMLANVSNRNGAGAPGTTAQPESSGTGASTAAGGPSSSVAGQEFFSPRPPNNNGVGELKTNKSGDEEEFLGGALPGGNQIIFTHTGKGGMAESAFSEDHDLSAFIAQSQMHNQVGLKSQTLQF